MWRKTLVKQENTIQETIQVIDGAALQIALVVNNEGKLVGTVTDGDIRRAILKHINLNEAVGTIMNPQPRYITVGQSREKALQLMQNYKLKQIPVLNEDGSVAGMEIAEDFFNPPLHSNTIVLMAGGLGQRLQPLTENCPKPLLKVGGKALLETTLENFSEEGFKYFYFSVNYRAQMIMDYFGDGSRWGVSIKYLHEKKRLGTAGALSLLPVKPLEPVLIMNGDILTKINTAKLLKFHLENRSAATICVKEQRNQIPYGVVNFEKNQLRNIDEKPVQHFFINAGIYVISPEVLDYVPEDTFFDITDLIKAIMKDKKEITVFPIREYWIDIGRLDDYEKANLEFAEIFT